MPIEMLGICEHSGIMLIMIMCGVVGWIVYGNKIVRMHVLYFFFPFDLRLYL